MVGPDRPPRAGGQLLADAVVIARDIVWRKVRVEALAALAPRLSNLSTAGLYRLWAETIPVLANRGREDLLDDLRVLGPVVLQLGGRTAVAEIFKAIQDVCRWWP